MSARNDISWRAAVRLTVFLVALYLLPRNASAQHALYGWGMNIHGQLNDGTTANRNAPVPVYGLDGVVDIEGSQMHCLGLTEDGTVLAWGTNQEGELGDGTSIDRLSPAPVPGLSRIIRVAAGYDHSLALDADGAVFAWGQNWYGQIGDGTTTSRHSPTRVGGLPPAISIAAGGALSLALMADGSVWEWGNNESGSTAARVSQMTGAIAIAASFHHGLALKSDGTVWTWSSLPPVVVPVTQAKGLTDVTAIAAGFTHYLALRLDGTVWAWGNNAEGELGDGTTVWCETPVQVLGLSGVTAIETNCGVHGVALKADGTVWTWGENGFGTLGWGFFNWDPNPIAAPVKNLKNVEAIWGGQFHCFARIAAPTTATTVRVDRRTGNLDRPVTLVSSLTRNDSGSPLSAQRLYFDVDGVHVGESVTSTDGRAAFPWLVSKALGLGEHRVTARFAGSGPFTASSGQGILTVCKAIARIEWAAASWNRYGLIGQTIMPRILLCNDLDGVPLPGRKVYFMYNGAIVGVATTGSDGSAVVPWFLSDGVGTGSKSLLASFYGDSQYYSCSSSTSFMVYKAVPQIVVDNVTGRTGQVVTLTAHLTRSRDRAPLAGRTILFCVEGQIARQATTDLSGTAAVTYTISAGIGTGSKTMTVRFNGDTLDYSATITADRLIVTP